MEFDQARPDAPRLFITGSTGFLGAELLKRLEPTRYSRIVLLNRRPARLPDSLTAEANVEIVQGSVQDQALYAGFLDENTTVVHMAGLTGKASSEEYFQQNTLGTELLIQAAAQAGVKAFLFISSIAVAFANREGYHYADSKEQAEEQLQASNLNYCIARPTFILGQGSPVLASLASLAKGPFILLPGKGEVLVQPVDVGDLADLLLAIIDQQLFTNQILELGGPEIVTMRALLLRIHRVIRGREGPVVQLPLGLIIGMLRILEKLFGDHLPVASGQFASFNNPTTIQPNPLVEAHKAGMQSVDAMLSVLKNGQEPLSVPKERRFGECELYTRYLAGQAPDDYLLAKYSAAFVPGMPLAELRKTRFESLLESVALKGLLFTRAVDGYSKLFLSDSNVRRKLILLLAILESRGDTASKLSASDNRGRLLMYAGFVGRTLQSALLLIVATAIFTPLRLFLSDRKASAGKYHG